MAVSFKALGSNDVTTTRTLLHESIPITGSIVSGTYGIGGAPKTTTLGSEENIKTYSHGMFQSVYDYPYLSSSANHIFDITMGYSSDSTLSGAGNSQNAKKINIYNQMTQVLMGYDETGSVRQFDEDGDIIAGGTKLKECFFLNFTRLLTKDEIKKGSFSVELGVTSGSWNPDAATGANFNKRIKLADNSGSNGYFVNSPAGEYGILFATSSHIGSDAPNLPLLDGETLGSAATNPPVGLIFYQAGIAVISGSVFSDAGATLGGGVLHSVNCGTNELATGFSDDTGFNAITGSTIDTIANGIRSRIYNISFNNTTELNSTIYFCRVNNTDFNYSTNPTYLSTSNGGPSEIVVKDGLATNDPVSYITTIGLYSADNELLAVGKVSEPLKKTPANELTLRVRLDY